MDCVTNAYKTVESKDFKALHSKERCSSGEVNEMERKRDSMRDWRLVLMRVSGYMMEWQMTPAIGWQGGEMYG